MPIDRSAFLYMEPSRKSYGSKDLYAQCASCMMWLKNKLQCMIHSPKVKATWDTTCGLYVNGEPAEKGSAHPYVTPKESGAVKSLVQCHRCKYFSKVTHKCLLFVAINNARETKDESKLYPERVHPNGCCNGWVAIGKTI